MLVACKKFPEGGYYRNARKIFNSKDGSSWNVVKFEVNGIDSTDFIVSNGDKSLLDNYVRFFYYSRDNYYSTKTPPAFELNFGNDELSFTNGRGSYGLCNGILIRSVLTPNGEKMKWKILKCKDGEMRLSASKGEYTYLVFLKD